MALGTRPPAKDDTGLQVQAITWTKKIKPGSAAMHPGV